VVTIGGGVVLDAAPLGRGVDAAARADFLRALENADEPATLTLRVARRLDRGLTLEQASHETGWLPSKVLTIAAPLIKQGKLARFGDVLIHQPSFTATCASTLGQLAAFHDANRLVAGMGKGELLKKTGLPADVFEGALLTLAREKKLEIAGEVVNLPGRSLAMRSDESEGKQRIQQAFATAGLKVPSLTEVLASLKVDRARAQQLVTLLLREGTLVKLADDLVFHRSTLAALKEQMKALKSTSPAMNVARFKEATGVSRKYAIPLLEYLDREHVTRRSGEERVIL